MAEASDPTKRERQTHPADPTGASIPELLSVARAGNAYFGELLARLSDEQFAEASLLPGWTRAHVIAHMCYNAFGLSRLMDWASTGVETPMYTSMDARTKEIEEGATRDPQVLRDLWADGIARLEAGWAAADDATWHATVRTARGDEIPAYVTLWMRSREIWVHAVDLDAGGRFEDLPPRVLRGVLDEVLANWHRRGADQGLILEITGDHADRLGDVETDAAAVVSGSLAAITAWATGRSLTGVTSSTGTVEQAPAWM